MTKKDAPDRTRYRQAITITLSHRAIQILNRLCEEFDSTRSRMIDQIIRQKSPNNPAEK